MTLKDWLASNDMTASELAEKAKVSASSISRFINGQSSLSARHMQAIVKHTARLSERGLTMDSLLREVEARQSAEAR